MHPAAPTVLRLALGLLFTIFGLNGFLGFMPNPPQPPDAGAFLGAMGATGYMFPMLKSFELCAGLLLLAGRFVPLALLMLAPIVVNIVAFSLALNPANPLAYVALAGELAVAWCYRGSFRGVLAARAEPSVGAPARDAQAVGPQFAP